MISLAGVAILLGVVVVVGVLFLLAAWVGFRTCLVSQKLDQAAQDASVRRAVAQHKLGFQKWFNQNFETAEIQVPKTPMGSIGGADIPEVFSEIDAIMRRPMAYRDQAPGLDEDEI